MPLRSRGRSSSPPMNRSSPEQTTYRCLDVGSVGSNGARGVDSDPESPILPPRRTKSVSFPPDYASPMPKTPAATRMLSRHSSTPSSLGRSSSPSPSLSSPPSEFGSPIPSLPLHQLGTPSKSKKRRSISPGGSPSLSGEGIFGPRGSSSSLLSNNGNDCHFSRIVSRLSYSALLFVVLFSAVRHYHPEDDFSAPTFARSIFSTTSAELTAENARLTEGVRKFKARMRSLRNERDDATRRANVERALRNNAKSELEDVKREREEQRRKAEEEYENVVGELRGQIREMSRREVIETFGPGPHRVQFTLLVPVGGGDQTGTATTQTHTMTVETAPLDLVPHSVNMFLRQISSRLWDNTEIFRSREHILVTRPFDHTTREDRFVKFKDEGAASLSYREHSDKYPHVKYTLGYAGRPGGPHWYINTLDNTQWHGPTPDSGDEGDPCFAMVVGEDGRALVDALVNLPKDADDKLLRPVVIESARILKQNGEGEWM